MKCLVIAEYEDHTLRPSSLAALGFATQVAEQTGGSTSWLLLGHELDDLAQQAAHYAPVLLADHRLLAAPTADRYAAIIAAQTQQHAFDLVVAASGSFSKDIVGRSGGLLGGAMASDVVAHHWEADRLLLQRPMYAGSVLATVTLHGSPQIITVRPTAYAPPGPRSDLAPIDSVTIDEQALPDQTEWLENQSKTSHRPDVSEARVVVSGGRAIRDSSDFEQLIGGLADALGGATGSSRALVDAGITPNEFQVGQTGKIIAPELYCAVGISGAVQHLAGMKNSKVIVAINQDAAAPIFEVADYGLIGDVYEVVPELIQRLKK